MPGGLGSRGRRRDHRAPRRAAIWIMLGSSPMFYDSEDPWFDNPVTFDLGGGADEDGESDGDSDGGDPDGDGSGGEDSEDRGQGTGDGEQNPGDGDSDGEDDNG
ncbi:hypothetical protein GCM10023167_19810 [Brevibacterium pityocampae]|uniref:Uncharacterized protein n=2 Tax=Brevibacteriaceae TaxID=85019 RepID=A0ABP8JK09_9MICO